MKSVKNILPLASLQALYYALVHSHLIYGIQIWSAAPSYAINSLITKQKYAIRIAHNSKYNAHTEPLFKASKTLPLPDLISYFKLLFMHDYVNSNLPSSFINVWQTNSDMRDPENFMQLRNDHEFFIPFSRLESCRKFPMYDFPRLWNDFPNDEIKSITSRILFKKSVKGYFLDKLSDIIVCNRLLCPSCHLNHVS
jgi:hypothetical protein